LLRAREPMTAIADRALPVARVLGESNRRVGERGRHVLLLRVTEQTLVRHLIDASEDAGH
jgi:hypothetical protein